MEPFLYDMNHVRACSAKHLFNVVSFFAGGGGSSTGYRLAGGKVLAINEFVPAAVETYSSNYPDTHVFPEDIREITGEYVLNTLGLKPGELDILDGSPPCASFSMAGLREKGWGRVKKYSDTEQRTDDLFYEFARILKEIQPKVFICENVAGLTMGTSKHLLGNKQRDMFDAKDETIYQTLIDCGYNVEHKVLNAKRYGVPQSRARVIIIGVRKDIKKKISFPRGLPKIVTTAEALNNETIQHLNIEAFKENPPKVVVKGKRCYTAPGDLIDTAIPYKIVRHGKGGYAKATIDMDFQCSFTNPMPTILANFTANADGLVEIEQETGERIIRKISIPELKVVSSFPLDYDFKGTYKKQCERMGRAVPPLMMRAIASHVYETILKDLDSTKKDFLLRKEFCNFTTWNLNY